MVDIIQMVPLDITITEQESVITDGLLSKKRQDYKKTQELYHDGGVHRWR
jgi:hypothetical protein